MKAKLLALMATVGLFASLPSLVRADVITLTFEGLKNTESILNFYNGGFGGSGSGPGPNLGITFGFSIEALISSLSGGTGNFSNNPSGSTVALLAFGGTGNFMNVAGGFDTGFSFFYATAFPGSVEVRSGLNGTGTVLASLDLPVTPNPFNVWDPIGVSFSGTAHSVLFGGTINFIVFDDITLGSSVPSVPGTIVGTGLPGLILACGVLIALARRRRKITC